MRNEEVLKRIGEEMKVSETIRQRKKKRPGHQLRRQCRSVAVLMGMV